MPHLSDEEYLEVISDLSQLIFDHDDLDEWFLYYCAGRMYLRRKVWAAIIDFVIIKD